MSAMRPASIVDLGGFRLGHSGDDQTLTGCTVILCPEGAVAGVDIRGSAPGTRETDVLHPLNLVDRAHAVLLTGGSAFGLAAADGVLRWLEERGHGFDTGVARVPIVPAAVLFDLSVGRSDTRPDADMGYAACLASTNDPGVVGEGNVGAGAGASAGKIMGPPRATKTGVGCAGFEVAGGLIVAAIMVANPFGDIRDHRSGIILAGARSPGGGWLDTARVLTGFDDGSPARPKAAPGTNTCIGVVATNAVLTKVQATKVAQMAHDGLARSVSPVHTMYDGDTIFVLSGGLRPVQADVSAVGTLAAESVSQAMTRCALSAGPAGGLPSATSLRSGVG